MSLLQIYQSQKDIREKMIEELYEDQLHAGIGVIGDYTLRIKNLERQIRDITEKIGKEAKNRIDNVRDNTTGIKIIKVFLASSFELKEVREQMEIFINRENNQLINRLLFIRLVVWEDFIDAMSKSRLQEEYNKIIRESDVFLSLYHTKVGMYTEEEFDVAFTSFSNTSRPFIYTYFKNVDQNATDSIEHFKHKLRDLGHYPTLFNDIYDLKYQFKMQLEKLYNNFTNADNFRPIK